MLILCKTGYEINEDRLDMSMAGAGLGLVLDWVSAVDLLN